MRWIEEIIGRPAQLNEALIILLGSYVLGCFTTGYYFVRWSTGQDIRLLGSGSVGAKNVWRVSGPFGFCVTLLGDFAKGALAVWMAAHFSTNGRFATLAVLFVVVGHIWPVQLRFHGGKGVCTSLGALLVFDYSMALAFLGLFAGLLALSRRLVLSGLLAFACLPLASIFREQPLADISTLAVLACLVLIAHRKNIAEEIAELFAHRQFEPKANQSPK